MFACWRQGARQQDEEAAAMPRLVPQEDELAALGAAGAHQCPMGLHTGYCQMVAELVLCCFADCAALTPTSL